MAFTFSAADALSDLDEIAWGDHILCVENLKNKRDLKTQINSYIGANCDEIVPMGFNSRIFSCDCIFDNSLQNSNFPTHFVEFMKSYNLGIAANFDHPIFGQILCICESADVEISNKQRSGVTVSCVFRETMSAAENSDLVELPNSRAGQTFSEHEIKKLDQNPLIKSETMSIGELLADIADLEKKIEGAKYIVSRQFSSKIGQIKNLQNSFAKAINTLTFSGTPEGTIAAQRLRIQKKNIEDTEKKSNLIRYELPEDYSIYAIASLVNNPVEVVIKNNPQIAGKIILKKGTSIYIQKGK